MHLAHTSEIVASLSDSMETEPQLAAHLLDLLVYQPDPEDFDHGLREFD
jgi:hypothetical protein